LRDDPKKAMSDCRLPTGASAVFDFTLGTLLQNEDLPTVKQRGALAKFPIIAAPKNSPSPRATANAEAINPLREQSRLAPLMVSVWLARLCLDQGATFPPRLPSQALR
jgi:hypothetical protein